jgi:DNA polymerase I
MTDQPAPKSKRLILIDGSGYIFRAYHGLPPLTRKSDGLPVGAVSGFCNMLFRLIKEHRGEDAPSHLAVIFDAGSKTFRNDIYAGYKAHRPPAPEDLIPQFPLIREATRAFGVSCVELKNYEADDLIATYAKMAVKDGFEVTIISSDKDLMQLVTQEISLMDPVKSTPVGRLEVIEKFGVPPELVVDAQALIGDASDNVPGAPGIGVKTAAQLLLEYGNLDQLLLRADEIKQPKRREALVDNREQILMSRELVRLVDTVPLPQPIDNFALADPDPLVLSAFLAEMEFTSLARRVGGTLSQMQTNPRSMAAPILKPQFGAPQASAPNPSTPAEILAPVNYDAYLCLQNIEALKAFVSKCKAAGICAVDTETDALGATKAGLVGISLAYAPNEAAYIPLRHVSDEGGLAFSGEDLKQIPLADALEVLKPLLEDKTVLKVGQNIKYDLSVLARYDVQLAPLDDTMLISYVLEAGLHGHGMDELSELHLGHTPIPFKQVAGSGKSAKSFKYVGLVEATRYAAEDADITLRLWHILKPRLQHNKLVTVYETLERNMPQVLSDMELRGVRVDPQILRQLSQDFGTLMGDIELKAHALVGRAFNLNSPQQLGVIFYDEMKLDGGKRTASGQWATDVKVLEDLAEKGEPLARLLLEYRQMAKLKGTYTDALVEHADPETQRIHTSYQLAATTTGRLSSNEPNLQNIPIRTSEGRKIRTAFIAKAGHKLISADYSQIELRILAHIGDITPLKKAFTEGLDIHAMTASEMFGVPIDGMPAEVRRRAKAINFGIIYGISAFGLANQLGIDNQEASRYIKTYFERFSGIKTYMDDTKAFVKAHGYVETILGRKIHIPDINAKAAGLRAFSERAAINAPIQGTAADIIRRAMIKMPVALLASGLKTKMLLQVHDELIFEAPDEEVDTAKALITQVMQNAALPAIEISVPLVVEAKAALNWDEAH